MIKYLFLGIEDRYMKEFPKSIFFKKNSPTRREIPELWGNNLWLIPLQVLKGFHFLFQHIKPFYTLVGPV